MPSAGSAIPRFSSAAGGGLLSGSSAFLTSASPLLIRLLSGVGTVEAQPTGNQERNATVTRQTLLHRVAPIGAALALGGGAGAAIYATTTGSDGSQTTVVASVPSQPAAQTVATTTTSLEQLYKDAAPGVVDITVGSDSSGFGPGGGQSQAEGSGFVIDKNGDIV